MKSNELVVNNLTSSTKRVLKRSAAVRIKTREARKRGIAIERVQVEVTGEFGAEGTAARNISYRASVDAKAAREEIIDLMWHTDSVAEIQNTLRCSSQIMLAYCEAREIQGPA
jgi:hypothetical protein